MKTFAACLFLFFAAAVNGQSPSEILATAAGKNFTLASLSSDGQELYRQQAAILDEYRQELLSQMVDTIVLETEAKARATTPERLLTPVLTKIAEPTNLQIKAVYEANRTQLGGRTLDETRGEIVRHIQHEATEKVIAAYLSTLRAKHKIVQIKDINARGLAAADVLVRIGTRSITAAEFQRNNAAAYNDREYEIYGNVRADLESAMLSVLVAEEARARGVEPGSIYAAEVTNKLRTYTDHERFELETALKKHLFAKYGAKIFLKEPEPFVQQISVDDDPSTGPVDAPVTIVMFSDFQCPACAAAHPILKKVIAEFPGKIRFVVRDYPLVGSHENAFRSALAANAAKAQGKFFEYIELLYANQQALDDISLKKYAAGLGLNLKQFELDLNDEKNAFEVRKDMADGRKYGVSWTPSIFVNGVKVRGSGHSDFREAIERALRRNAG